jgi:hypothetical protein
VSRQVFWPALIAVLFFFPAWPAKAQNTITEACTARCAEAIALMEARATSADDLRVVFIVNQTCVVRKTCATLAEFDDPVWLSRVLYGFAWAFVNAEGEWPAIEAGCFELVFWPTAFCTDSMVRYHINSDLYSVLSHEGCGTAHDWKLVGDTITRCLLEAGGFINWAGMLLLPSYRDAVRARCLGHQPQQ